jgi:hypothetical protein
MKEIILTLTIEEAQGILNALSLRPYQEVFLLINKVIGQVKSQESVSLPPTPAPTS